MRRLLGCLAAAILLGGCSPAQYFAQPASVEETRDAVREMKARQEVLLQKIDAIEKQLAALSDARARDRADLNAQLGTLTEDLQQISSRLDDMSGQIQRRAPAASLYPTPVNPPVEPDTVSGGEEAAPPRVDAEQVYDGAYRDMVRGSYPLAVAGFREFLRLFPDHSLADNAQYWVGECYYAQDDPTKASEEFRKVLEKYPEGDKVPAAHLKLGYCALRLNDVAGARRYLDELIRRYPTSEEARSARNKLATLN